jgi:hypothetical protein
VPAAPAGGRVTLSERSRGVLAAAASDGRPAAAIAAPSRMLFHLIYIRTDAVRFTLARAGADATLARKMRVRVTNRGGLGALVSWFVRGPRKSDQTTGVARMPGRKGMMPRTGWLPLALGVVMLVCAAPVGATEATANVSGGALTLIPPATASFAVTLDGSDQTATSPQAFDVEDNTGSGAGWAVSATSTTFSSQTHSLPTNAVTFKSAPSEACDSDSECALASDTVQYPYTLPAGMVAPTATTLIDAADGTGLGDETLTMTASLLVPAATPAGSYSSTWTYSITAGP